MDRLADARHLPKPEQFLLVLSSPFDDKSQRARRKPTPNNCQATNIDHRFFVSVFRVKMGRRMISIVHFDDNSEEAADFRHFQQLTF